MLNEQKVEGEAASGGEGSSNLAKLVSSRSRAVVLNIGNRNFDGRHRCKSHSRFYLILIIMSIPGKLSPLNYHLVLHNGTRPTPGPKYSHLSSAMLESPQAAFCNV